MGNEKKSKVTVQEPAKKLAPVKEFSWQDASILLKKPSTSQEVIEQKIIIAHAIAYDLPPQCIAILGGKPYVEKSGWELLFNRHKGTQGWSRFLSKPIEMAKKVGDTAIFVTTIYDKNEKKMSNGYGTANAANTKMSTMKVFLNELAETRSQNRCLRKVCTPFLYKAFMKNMKKLDNEQKVIVAENANTFGKVSAEEVGAENGKEVKPEALLSEEDTKVISGVLQDIVNAKTQKQLAFIASKIKAGKSAGKYKEKQIKVLKEAYITKFQKLSFSK